MYRPRETRRFAHGRIGGVGYSLGVDVGTTFTAAAIVRDGHTEMAVLGTRAAAVPTILFIGEDGEILVGEAARRRMPSDPERVAREFKRRIGDAAPIFIGGTPRSAESLMALALRWVVERVTEQEGAAPDRTVVTHPANWGPYRRELLGHAIRQSDVAGVSTLTEPEAAAAYYAATERVERGELVAVYDLGGGTFDAALLRRTSESFEIAGAPEGIEHLGGIDVDDAIFERVRRALGGAVEALDVDDPAALRALHRLREECVEAKEALSFDARATVPVLLPGVQAEVVVTRAELEQTIRPMIADTIAGLRRAFASAGVGPSDVRAVVLVGGSSRIPLVGEMITAELGRPVAVDAHPKHAVALGAAAVAGRATTAVSAGAEPAAAAPPLEPAAAAPPPEAAPPARAPEPEPAPPPLPPDSVDRLRSTGTETIHRTDEEPVTRRRRSRLPVIAALAAAVVLAVVVGLVVVGGDDNGNVVAGDASTTVGEQTTESAAPTTEATTTTLPTPADVRRAALDSAIEGRPVFDPTRGRIYGASYKPLAFDLGNLAPYVAADGIESNTASPATFAHDLLYVGDDDNAVYAFDADTLALRWQQPVGGGIYGAPAVSDNLVFVGADDGNLYGFDALTGDPAWGPYSVGSAIHAGPTVTGGLVIAGGDEEVHAVDIATQTLKWRVATGMSASATVADGVVYFLSQDWGLLAVDLETGREKWRFELDEISVTPPAVNDGVVYVVTIGGTLWAVAADDGEEVWMYATGGAVASAPLVADGVVYFGSDDANVYAFRTNGDLLWTFQTDGEVRSWPLLADGVLIMSTPSTLYGIVVPTPPPG